LGLIAGRMRLLAFVTAALLLAAPARAALPPAQIAALKAAATTSLVQRHVPSVVIAVDRNGVRQYAGAWGFRNLADRLPANVDTLYEYGSITKQFTAAAIMLLAQDGKLKLDTDVGTYFPQFANRGITIADLLIHDSGIPDYLTDDFGMQTAPLPFAGPDVGIAWAAKQPLDFPVGTKAQYSNTGYTMLARIVEKVSGKPFEAFLHDRLIAPAGMRTARGYRMLAPTPNMALGYQEWTKALAAYDPSGSQGGVVGSLINALPWNLRDADGAGYLVGDAADLQAWGNALLAGKLLHGKWRAIYFSKGKLKDGSPAYTGPENPGKVRAAYCYGGLGIWSDRGYTIYGANGGTAGFSTFTATVPALHLTVTTLTNLGQTTNASLTVPVIDALLE